MNEKQIIESSAKKIESTNITENIEAKYDQSDSETHEVNNIFTKVYRKLINFWKSNHGFARFFRYFMVGNFITIIQFIILPLLQAIFKRTNLLYIDFHFLGPIGSPTKISEILTDGTVVYDPYYVYNFTAGNVGDHVYRTYNGISGQYLSHGGLGYFLAIFITLIVAQILTFIMQRKVVFKSNSNVLKAVIWFIIATVIITLGQNALYGVYQPYVYKLFGDTTGGIIASFTQAVIAFWVFYPIFKYIFKENKTVVNGE